MTTFTASKECRTCKEIKPITDFYSMATKKDGTPTYKLDCKSCDNKLSWERKKRAKTKMPSYELSYATDGRAPKLPLSKSADPEVQEAVKVNAAELSFDAMYTAAQEIIKSGDELTSIQQELDTVRNMLSEAEAKYHEAKQRWLNAVNTIKQHEPS
jgi:hypothetical protein